MDNAKPLPKQYLVDGATFRSVLAVLGTLPFHRVAALIQALNVSTVQLYANQPPNFGGLKRVAPEVCSVEEKPYDESSNEPAA